MVRLGSFAHMQYFISEGGRRGVRVPRYHCTSLININRPLDIGFFKCWWLVWLSTRYRALSCLSTPSNNRIYFCCEISQAASGFFLSSSLPRTRYCAYCSYNLYFCLNGRDQFCVAVCVCVCVKNQFQYASKNCWWRRTARIRRRR